MSKFASDLKWSAWFFQWKVWPLIMPHLSGGELLQMEGRPDTELARQLDMKAGIDGWHVHQHGMRGIASRVQEAERPWDSFTVRMSRNSGAKTEFEKRTMAIDNPEKGWIYPAITVQAYVKTRCGPLLSCGIAKTKDILDFIRAGHHKVRKVSNATFAACFWRDMVRQGYQVKIVKPEAATPGLRLVKGNFQTNNQPSHAMAKVG